MTDITDHYGRRGAAAGITDLHRPRLATEPGSVNRTATPPPAPVPTVDTPRSDLEQIAEWIAYLTYADMKALAAGILGADAKPEQVIELADKMHAWAVQARRTA